MYRKLSPIALCFYLYLCGTPPPDPSLSPTWPIGRGLYVGGLSPRAGSVPLNQLHA